MQWSASSPNQQGRFLEMVKKKKDDELVQIVFRVPRRLHQTLRESARLLNLDMSHLLRFMLTEHVAEYWARGNKCEEELRRLRVAAEKPTPRAGSPFPPEGGQRYVDV